MPRSGYEIRRNTHHHDIKCAGPRALVGHVIRRSSDWCSVILEVWVTQSWLPLLFLPPVVMLPWLVVTIKAIVTTSWQPIRTTRALHRTWGFSPFRFHVCLLALHVSADTLELRIYFQSTLRQIRVQKGLLSSGIVKAGDIALTEFLLLWYYASSNTVK